jgi:hypothetical protein
LKKLVADAVAIEPVSTSNSLLTGKRTGNFTDSGLRQATDRVLDPQNQLFSAEFAARQNREFSSRHQGS